MKKLSKNLYQTQAFSNARNMIDYNFLRNERERLQRQQMEAQPLLTSNGKDVAFNKLNTRDKSKVNATINEVGTNTPKIATIGKMQNSNNKSTKAENKVNNTNNKISNNKSVQRTVKQENYKKQAESKGYSKHYDVDTLPEYFFSLSDSMARGVTSSLLNTAQGVANVVDGIGDLLTGTKDTQPNKVVNTLNKLNNAVAESPYKRLDGLGGKTQDIANAIGGVAPTMAMSFFLPGSGTVNTALSSYGGGINEALNDNADIDKARLYGLSNAAVETATEKITGGIPFMKAGGLDKIADKAINKIANDTVRNVADFGYKAFGEGLEEYLSSVAGEFSKDIYQGKDGKGTFTERLANVQPEALESGLMGAAVGGVLNAPSAISNQINIHNENKNKAISKSETEQGVQSQVQEETPLNNSQNSDNIEPNTVADNERQLESDPVFDDLFEQEPTNTDDIYADKKLGIKLSNSKNYDDLAKRLHKELKIKEYKKYIDDIAELGDSFVDNSNVFTPSAMSKFAEGVADKSELSKEEIFDYLYTHKGELKSGFVGLQRQSNLDEHGPIREDSIFPTEKKNFNDQDVSQATDTLINNYFKKVRESSQYLRDKVTTGEIGTKDTISQQETNRKAYDFINQYQSFGDAYQSIIEDGEGLANLKPSEQVAVLDSMVQYCATITNSIEKLPDSEQRTNELARMADINALTIEKAVEYNSDIGRALNMVGVTQKLMPKLFRYVQHQKNFEHILQKVNENLPENKKISLSEDLLKEIYSENAKDFTQEHWQEIADKVTEEIIDKTPRTFWDKLRNIRYTAMLLNPKTIVRNILGNTLHYSFMKASDVIRVGTEYLFVPKGKRTTVIMRDRSLLNYIKANETTLNNDRTYKYLDMDLGKTGTVGPLRKLMEYTLDKPDKFFSKHMFTSSLSDYLQAKGVSKGELAYIMQNGDLILDNEVNINGKKLSKEDLLFKKTIIENGVEFAKQRSKEVVYREDNIIAEKLNNLKYSKDPTLRVVGNIVEIYIPFTKTPFNITRSLVKYSPVGFAKSTYDLCKAISTNQDISAPLDNFCRGFTGTGLTMFGFMLAANGLMTGSGDGYDERERRFLEETEGWKPYSLHIGDKYIDVTWLAPTSAPLVIGSQLQETIGNYVALKQFDNDGNVQNVDLLNDMQNIVLAMSSPIFEMSALSGLEYTIPKSSDSLADTVTQTMVNGFTNYFSSFIPAFIKNIGQIMDGTVRTSSGEGTKTEQVISKMFNKVPFMGDKFNPALDYRGNEKQVQEDMTDGWVGRAVNKLLNPANYGESANDETARELYRLYGIDKNAKLLPETSYVYDISYDEVDYELTDEDFTDFNKMYRSHYMEAVDDFMSSDLYSNIDDNQRIQVLADLKQLTFDNEKRLYLSTKGVDYSTSMLEKVMNGVSNEERQFLPYETLFINNNATSKSDVITYMSTTGYSLEDTQQYVQNVLDETLTENDELKLMGIYEMGDVFNELYNEAIQQYASQADFSSMSESEINKGAFKIGSKISKALGQAKAKYDLGYDVSTTDYDRMVRAINGGIDIYTYCLIIENTSINDQMKFMKDSLGFDADMIYAFQKNVMKRRLNDEHIEYLYSLFVGQ